MSPNTIRQALFSAVPNGTHWPGDGYDYLVELDGIRHKIVRDRSVKTPPDGFVNGWIWEQRHSKPWQEAVEEIVRRFYEASYYGMHI